MFTSSQAESSSSANSSLIRKFDKTKSVRGELYYWGEAGGMCQAERRAALRLRYLYVVTTEALNTSDKARKQFQSYWVKQGGGPIGILSTFRRIYLRISTVEFCANLTNQYSM